MPRSYIFCSTIIYSYGLHQELVRFLIYSGEAGYVYQFWLGERQEWIMLLKVSITSLSFCWSSYFSSIFCFIFVVIISEFSSDSFSLLNNHNICLDSVSPSIYIMQILNKQLTSFNITPPNTCTYRPLWHLPKPS